MSEPEALSRLGDYWIVAPLGHGGMARVDLAVKDGQDDIVVLKQLLAGLEDDDETARRFLREAKIASALEHPGIARVQDVFEANQRVCLAMDFVPGVTFEELNKRCWGDQTACPPAVAVSMVKQLLEALEYAHDFHFQGRPAGIVHRDLSTKNLLLAFNGRVKVIDFGVAKGEVDDLRTATGMLMGTPLYMSPEQAKGQRVDRRSDLYTAGVVLWEMLAGRRLIKAKGRAAMLHAVASQPSPALSSVGDLPRAFDSVLARALAKEPDQRFSTASEFLAALVPVAAEVGLLSPEELSAFVVERLPDREAQVAETIRAARGAAPNKRAVARIALASPGQLPPSNAPQPRPLDSVVAAEITQASFKSGPIEAASGRASPLWAVLGGLVVLGGIFGFQTLRESSPTPAPAQEAPAVIPRAAAQAEAKAPAQAKAQVGPKSESEAARKEPPGEGSTAQSPRPSGEKLRPRTELRRAAAGSAPAEPTGSSPGRGARPSSRALSLPAPVQDEPARGTLIDSPSPSRKASSPERDRLKAKLQTYVQSANPEVAASMVVELRRRSSEGTARRQRCLDPILNDLVRVDYYEVEDVRPLFLEALECL